jgi:2-polyprenyl-6-methoxyphenol hydroxylase-like FAD-dependent oxidoreductase
MLSGIAGDHPPGDEAGFVGFARSLAAPDVAAVIARSESASEIAVHKFPSSRRRRFERLARVPSGFVVLGDGFASFNPMYGQGMTSAALQVAALTGLLADGHTPTTVVRPYYRAASKIIDRFWQLAAGEDFRFRETSGHKAFGTDLLNAYGTRVHRASHRDQAVCLAFLKVMHMLAPPTTLFHPRIVLSVLGPAGAKRASRHDA